MFKNIKGIILLLIVFVFFSTKSVMAQDVGLGFKASLNINTQLNNFQFTSGDLALDLSPSVTSGYQLGLIYRNRIRPNIRLQTEPSFSKIGAQYNESFIFRGFNFETDSEIKLYYIDLPLLIEFTTTPPDLQEFPKPWEETTYHLSFGLYGSYLLDATFTGVNSGNPIGIDFEEEFSNDVTSEFNPLDAGIIVGGGFEYGYLNKIGVQTRLTFGLLNPTSNNQIELKAGNVALSFTLYYLL